MYRVAVCLLALLCISGKPLPNMPHLLVDAKAKQIRVECEVLRPDQPLEFVCVVNGTSDHEALLRTRARPSHIHLLLLALGVKPGTPVKYDPATEATTPPTGGALKMSIEVTRHGKKVVEPVHTWMRHVRTGKSAPEQTFVFVGSRVMQDGVYAADAVGYIVSLVNFELSMCDVPRVASKSNEDLEWAWNPKRVPAAGTKVWLIIEPVQQAAAQPKKPKQPAKQ